MNEAQHRKINAACVRKTDKLAQMAVLLEYIEGHHMKGDKWVAVNDQPALALMALEELDMIQVIEFNDGKHYAQMKGAL